MCQSRMLLFSLIGLYQRTLYETLLTGFEMRNRESAYYGNNNGVGLNPSLSCMLVALQKKKSRRSWSRRGPLLPALTVFY